MNKTIEENAVKMAKAHGYDNVTYIENMGNSGQNVFCCRYDDANRTIPIKKKMCYIVESGGQLRYASLQEAMRFIGCSAGVSFTFK